MYRVYEENLISEDDVAYIAYGIACDDMNLAVSDVTLDKNKIIRFVNLLNDNELSPVHLMDVITDYLYELQ